MSVNYYARTPETPDDDEGLHIGQHAGGSEFLFRAHANLGLTTVQAWHDYLSRPEVSIVAEHGLVEDLAEFWPDAIARPADVPYVMSSRWPLLESASDRRWRDVKGHPFANYEFC